MGNSGQSSLRGMICVPEERTDAAAMRPWKAVERRTQPIMPVFQLPKLPTLQPGRPLDPEQRKELVELQQQVQAQLMQQRVLVESLRQLPQFRNMAPTASGPGSSEMATDPDDAKWQHVIGPDPIGDTPADDPESGEEDKSLKSAVTPNRQEDDKTSNSTLGTTTKVYVDFSTDLTNASDRKDNVTMLLEWDELMKRGGIGNEDTGEPSISSPKMSTIFPADPEKQSETSAVRSNPSAPSQTSKPSQSSKPSQVSGAAALKRTNAEPPVAPRRPMPSPAPNGKQENTLKELKDRAAMSPNASGPAALLGVADLGTLGTTPPGREERRWIEAAVRRMFRSLGPAALDAITESFREWKLPASVAIVKQQSRISMGPGLCVLFEGVVDVLHRPTGAVDNEKVFTYDRCGQCFGELELFYDVPRASGAARKLHWATIATRTPVTLWTIQRDVLRGSVPGAMTTNIEASSPKPKSAPSQAPAPLCVV